MNFAAKQRWFTAVDERLALVAARLIAATMAMIRLEKMTRMFGFFCCAWSVGLTLTAITKQS